MASNLRRLLEDSNLDIEILDAVDNIGSDTTAIELESIFDVDYRDYYEEYSWNLDGTLNQKDIYADNTKATQIYQIDFTYSSGLVRTKVIQNLLSGETLTITYAWSGTTLQSKTRVLT